MSDRGAGDERAANPRRRDEPYLLKVAGTGEVHDIPANICKKVLGSSRAAYAGGRSAPDFAVANNVSHISSAHASLRRDADGDVTVARATRNAGCTLEIHDAGGEITAVEARQGALTGEPQPQAFLPPDWLSLMPCFYPPRGNVGKPLIPFLPPA